MTSRRSALTQVAILAGGLPLAFAGHTQADAATKPAASVARDPDDPVLHVVDVRDAGAVGDGTTDDAAPIEKAIATAAGKKSGGAQGGIVYFPPGVYATTKPIALPKNVYLVGEGPPASRLTYIGADTDAFVTYGADTTISTFGGVRGLWVEGNGKVQRTLLLYGPQEGSTVAESLIAGARQIGIDVRSAGIEGGSNKFVIDRCWVWTIGDAGSAGVSLGPTSGPLTIRDTTFVGTNRGADAPANSAGVVAVGSIVTIDNVNVERFESHTYLDKTNAEIRSPTGFFNRYGVKTSARSTNTAVYLTGANFDNADASVLDQGADVRIRFCHSYWSEAYKDDQRQFRHNFWDVGSARVWRDDDRQAQFGWDSPAGGDGTVFAISTRAGGSWRRSAEIDANGLFGSADSSFDGAHLRLGAYHLWVDGSGHLRMKNGAPGSDTDGSVVGG